MATVYWVGDSAATAQITVGTVSTAVNDDTYNIILTDEEGDTVTFTKVAASSTVTTIADSLVADWNAHGNAAVARVTASNSAGAITLTADTAGIPFSVSFTRSGGSSAWTSQSTTTANAGPNDFATASNWSGGAVPTASEGIVIPGNATASILYSLNQSSISFDKFVVEDGYTGQLGGTDGGYLRFSVDASADFKFAGSGQAWIDIAASNVDPVIDRTASALAGSYGLSLKGTALSDIYLNRGNLGFGIEPDDTTSEVGALHVGYIANEGGDATCTIGEDVKDLDGSAYPDINMYGGTVIVRSNVGVLNQYSSAATYRQNLGGWTTAIINGTAYPNDAATYVTTTLGPNSRLLNTESTIAKTFTNVTAKDGCEIQDPGGRIIWTNGIDFASQFMGNCTLNFGYNKILTPTNS